jgi:hypothetical protein
VRLKNDKEEEYEEYEEEEMQRKIHNVNERRPYFQ